MNNILLAGALTACLGLSHGADAADFSIGGDPDLSCFATMTGRIVPGDADRLHAFLKNTYSANREGTVAGVEIPAIWSDFQMGARLCLDSPGGSLSEAVRMADVLLGARDEGEENLTGIGTAIPAGATCESACAILFLAGGKWISAHTGRRADRVLHIDGKLGFHAPSITVEDQVYDKGSVEKSFEIALESIAAVGNRMSFLRMRQSLMQLILDTPPASMSYVSTLGQAAEWNILLSGVPKLPDPSPHNLMQACFNLRRAVRPDGASIVEGTTLSRAKTKDDLPLDAYRHPGFPAGAFELTEVTSGRMARVDRDGDWLDFETEPHSDVDFVTCRGDLNGQFPEGNGAVSSSAGEFIAIPNWYFLPPNLSFAASQRLAGPDGILEADTLLEEQIDGPRETTCYVFDARGRKTDEERCSVTVRDSLPASLAYLRTWDFTWPSGASTTLEAGAGWNTMDGEIRGPMAINGGPGDLVGPPEGASLDRETAQCLRNPSSGNTFCFAL